MKTALSKLGFSRHYVWFWFFILAQAFFGYLCLILTPEGQIIRTFLAVLVCLAWVSGAFSMMFVGNAQRDEEIWSEILSAPRVIQFAELGALILLLFVVVKQIVNSG